MKNKYKFSFQYLLLQPTYLDFDIIPESEFQSILLSKDFFLIYEINDFLYFNFLIHKDDTSAKTLKHLF